MKLKQSHNPFLFTAIFALLTPTPILAQNNKTSLSQTCTIGGVVTGTITTVGFRAAIVPPTQVATHKSNLYFKETAKM